MCVRFYTIKSFLSWPIYGAININPMLYQKSFFKRLNINKKISFQKCYCAMLHGVFENSGGGLQLSFKHEFTLCPRKRDDVNLSVRKKKNKSNLIWAFVLLWKLCIHYCFVCSCVTEISAFVKIDCCVSTEINLKLETNNAVIKYTRRLTLKIITNDIALK